MHPAVLHVGGGGFRVLVVAEKHVGVAHHDFADAMDVRIVDADFDVVGHRHARGIGIDLAARMQRVGAEQFGLAVQRAQRHAHGLEEFEGLGPERRTAGRGRSQPGKTEPVAQRAKQERVGDHRMLALRQRRQARSSCRAHRGFASAARSPSRRRGRRRRSIPRPAARTARRSARSRGNRSSWCRAASTKLIFIRHSRPLPST